MRFENKVAIITGASDGIGKGTALLLAREGAKVVLNARGAAKLEIAAQEIVRLGHMPLVVTGDICLSETVDRIIASTIARWGRIDILVNNVSSG